MDGDVIISQPEFNLQLSLVVAKQTWQPSRKLQAHFSPLYMGYAWYSNGALLKILDEKDSANTVQATKIGVRIFEHFLVERGWMNDVKNGQVTERKYNLLDKVAIM